MVISLKRENVLKIFKQKYGNTPEYLVRAPGRVNLIGEHTDYNEGFVMPLAINYSVWIASSPIPEPEVHLHSIDFNQSIIIPITKSLTKGEGWSEYLKGIISIFNKYKFELAGWKGVVAGDIPIGAGLSSSAALGLAIARTFGIVSNWDLDSTQMARICQIAENQWVGLNCGIMDQMISASGQKDHAMLIDCRSLKATPIPIPEGVRVIILDTCTRRGLVDSAYNERRKQCESVASFFGQKTLRDVSYRQLYEAKEEINPINFKRALHVIRENKRVLDCAESLRLGNLDHVGELMNSSHISLRNDFEVSSNALDLIVEIALKTPGCFGARMTGAGFGGCAVALVETKNSKDFVKKVLNSYHRSTGKKALLYECKASAGTSYMLK